MTLIVNDINRSYITVLVDLLYINGEVSVYLRLFYLCRIMYSLTECSEIQHSLYRLNRKGLKINNLQVSVGGFIGQKGFGIRGGDETKAAIESGTADLPGFRGVSGGKRAVRSNRRQQLESLNNRGDKETASRPYGRDSEQDDGRVRSLVPNPDMQAKYFKWDYY